MNFNSKEEFQSTALQLLKEKNYTGVVVGDTGSAKSKIAIDAIKEGNFKNILITSPRTNLKENWRKELEKWGFIKEAEAFDSHWGYKNLHLNITLENIQTAYKRSYTSPLKRDFDLIIYDEIHTCGKEYFNLIDVAQIFDVPIIGLTATPNNKDDWKKEVLYKAVPILIEYHNAEEDSLVNSCKYWIYEYELSDNYKVLTGTKTKKWLEGEAKQYTYLTEQYNKAKKLMFDQGATEYFNTSLLWMKGKQIIIGPDPYNVDDSEVIPIVRWEAVATKEQKIVGTKFFFAVRKRKEFLWNLESSKQIALALKKKILDKQIYKLKEKQPDYPIPYQRRDIVKSNKVLLFSELTQQAEKLSPYSIHSNNGNSAKEVEANNKKLLEQFNNGTIRELSSVRSLQLGLNMSEASWAIFESYSSSEVNSKQAKGRLNRLDINDIANIIIIKPLDTQAVKWYNKAFNWIKDYTVINSVEGLKI